MIELADAVAISLGAPPPGTPGIVFDLTITLGNLLSIASMMGIVALYVIDTRYSSKGARGEARKISAAVSQLAREMREHADEDTRRFEEVRRETGEVVAAIRTKVNEVELYARDHFVRRDSFQVALNQQGIMLTTMIADLKSWMERIERRINRTTPGGESG